MSFGAPPPPSAAIDELYFRSGARAAHAAFRDQNRYEADMPQMFASICAKGSVARTKGTSGQEKMGEKVRMIA